MGGRGTSLRSKKDIKESNDLVPYDEWGEMMDEYLYDEDGAIIGRIEDSMVYVQEPESYAVTKKDVLSDIDGWRNDDGTYGGEDERFYFAYKDGTVLSEEDLLYTTKSGEVRGRKYKTTGLIGVAISTGDYEMVWGNEFYKGQLVPLKTWSEDGESGLSNSYSGYKTTGVYKIRTRTTYNNYDEKRGVYKTKHERLRQSTIHELDR